MNSKKTDQADQGPISNQTDALPIDLSGGMVSPAPIASVDSFSPSASLGRNLTEIHAEQAAINRAETERLARLREIQDRDHRLRERKSHLNFDTSR